MIKRTLLVLALFCSPSLAQNWSTFLDSSRAVDWSTIGFTKPAYSVNCATQPSVSTGSSNASTNGTAINNAIASCDSTHNVINIPSGTYFTTNIRMVKSNVVLRGAGPTNTVLIHTTGCGGSEDAGICMEDLNDGLHAYNGSASVLPSGAQQCLWSSGYAQGSTTIGVTSCGGAPQNNHLLILDQADDLTDTTGYYVCQANATSNCGYEAPSGGSGNVPGRNFGGHAHSQQQVTFVTGVTSLGGGAYTLTIAAPGVLFPNIRSGQVPGAWWGGQIQNVGVENLTITANKADGGGSGFSSAPDNVNMYDCYHCWIDNVVSKWAGRAHVLWMQAGFDQIRNSYFYNSQNHNSQSYVVEYEAASWNLIENSIFQQVTNPMMFGTGAGNVIGYNYAINDVWTGGGAYLFGAFPVHNGGSAFNLWEGNNFPSLEADDAFGSGDLQTYYRMQLRGWQTGLSLSTFPIMNRSNNRGWNFVGNVLGQPGYHTQYQAIATSTSAGTGGGAEDTSIYSLGWGNTGAACSPITCDPLVVTTSMRWANYDVVTAGTKFDTAEASPASVNFIGANFTSGYFTGLAHTLPASLYYSSIPAWWTSGKNWPAIGFDVTTGNVGTCTGTYSGAPAVSTSQCSGGTLSTAWASHVTSIPAQDCYLNTMHGPPDGSGSVLAYDYTLCASPPVTPTSPAPPKALTSVVN